MPGSPIFGQRADADAWATAANSCPLNTFTPISDHARAVAVAVFRAAAVWKYGFWAPTEAHILAWGGLFDSSPRRDMSWLTVDLAERAVTEHFRTSVTGWFLPADVLRGAALLRLEQEAQRGT
ncbi:hypothetical protein [Nocardia fluminea]|uniref:hypothetical protein n=1 Tax=Nocardia fluminea TaxID=134984 RepID=UPI00117C98C5|nr:hypothetical protein [Nocardia fluminea]